jgi:hypothetical protein
MKIGVGYSAFNGIELLEHSIKQIRNQVDFITVFFQKYDWYGKTVIKDEDYQAIIQLKMIGLIDNFDIFEIPKFATNFLEAKKLEKEKRNKIKSKCAFYNCTHHLQMDVDEFYKNEDFEIAKYVINRENYKYTYCKIQDYYKLPIYRRKNISNSYVPFICEINNKELGINNIPNITIDPTRGYVINPEDKFYIFGEDDLLMHHMTGVRKDLMNKYLCTSQACLDRNNLNKLVNNISVINDKLIFKNEGFFRKNIIEDVEFEEVKNYFNIPLELF